MYQMSSLDNFVRLIKELILSISVYFVNKLTSSFKDVLAVLRYCTLNITGIEYDAIHFLHYIEIMYKAIFSFNDKEIFYNKILIFLELIQLF